MATPQEISNMPNRDLYHFANGAQTINPAAYTASVTGTGVNLQGYEGVDASIFMGALTDGTHTPKLQESSDNSTFTDVAAGDLLGSFSALVTLLRQKLGYSGH